MTSTDRRVTAVPIDESGFAAAFDAQVLWRMRWACAVAACFSLLFIALDQQWLPPDIGALVLRWRLGVLLPALLVGVVMTYLPAWRRHQQYIGGAMVLCSGLALVAMVWTAHHAETGYPYEGVSLFLLFNYFLCGLRFRVATFNGTVISAAFVLAEVNVLPAGPALAEALMFVLATHVAGMVGCYISERQARATFIAEQRLDALANHDGLTGLLNRRAFDRRARQIFQRYLRTPHPRGALRIAMIDIDYFKRYNDHHGHPAGDTVLHAVAAALSAQLHDRDSVVARYGGEEFVALGHWQPGQPQSAPFEQLRQQVQALAIAHADSDAASVVSVSIGVARWHDDGGDTLEQALGRADQALYRAKAAGRNRVEVAADQ
ncbi:diguanylate cyclase [Stenotrophomonas sp. ZAC14D2_NAIMI4_7]|uniref:GGDEF domain-containing protein n=1 Tax=Stenotrophomonas sp. ZAC14D2_NAIMI4_7 TaxID=2072405 RepID=UPI00131F42F4|nr:diguanylate cyclase [Stenotrophomonas sp. ZAC14D2_NAIMI4_7]